DPAQGLEGWLASLRAELLPPLSTSCAPRRTGRHLDQPCRLPMRSTSVACIDMSDANPELRLLPKLVLGLGALLLVAGVLWYGITMEIVFRILRNLVNRPSEPMSFRFILQPAMAVVAAIHDGIKDAKAGRSRHFWTVLRNPEKWVGRLREGLYETATILLLAMGMAVLYRINVLKALDPVEGL